MQCCSSLWWKWAFNELPHVKNEESLLASVSFEDFPIFGWHAQKVKTKFHHQEGSAFLRALFLKMLPPPTTSHKRDHFLGLFKSCCGISTHTAYFLQNSAHWLHTYCCRFQHFRYSPIYATCAACELCNPHVCLSPFSRNIISDFS